MSDTTALKQEARDLIARMDAAKTLNDDQFVAFADEVDLLLPKLKGAVASGSHDDELELVTSSLRASFAKLSAQLSFCTLE